MSDLQRQVDRVLVHQGHSKREDASYSTERYFRDLSVSINDLWWSEPDLCRSHAKTFRHPFRFAYVIQRLLTDVDKKKGKRQDLTQYCSF